MNEVPVDRQRQPQTISTDGKVAATKHLVSEVGNGHGIGFGDI